MFYVAMRNHSYECWRLTGSRPDWDDKERPFWIRRYDFDDVDLWPDEKLREELERVSRGRDYDPYAMVAIDLEMNRRKGKEYFRTFEDWNEMIVAL